MTTDGTQALGTPVGLLADADTAAHAATWVFVAASARVVTSAGLIGSGVEGVSETGVKSYQDLFGLALPVLFLVSALVLAVAAWRVRRVGTVGAAFLVLVTAAMTMFATTALLCADLATLLLSDGVDPCEDFYCPPVPFNGYVLYGLFAIGCLIDLVATARGMRVLRLSLPAPHQGAGRAATVTAAVLTYATVAGLCCGLPILVSVAR